MSIRHLPYEVMENIFKILHLTPHPNRDMVNCALVCKAWYLPARRVSFAKLNVTDISRALNFITAQNTEMGALCKVLQFNRVHRDRKGPPEEYEQLFSYLPNIQTIIIENNYHREHLLKQITRNAQLIPKVKEILLGRGMRKPASKFYYRCVMAFQDTLQNMTLDPMGESGYSFDRTYAKLFASLSYFTALTTLQIVNYKNTQAPNFPHLTMFSILRSCPNLISFSLINDVCEPEEEDRIDTFNHSKLKYLDLSLSDVTKRHIDYIITNITQLKEFRLMRRSFDSIPWMERFGADLVKKIQNYLAGIERMIFYMGVESRTSIAEYWSFIRGVIGNQLSTPVHIYLEAHDPLSCHSAELLLNKCVDNIYIQCGMNAKEFPSITAVLVSPIQLHATIAPLEVNNLNVQSFNLDIHSVSGRNALYKLRWKILETLVSCFKSPNNLNIKINYAPGSNFNVDVTSKENNDNLQYGHHKYFSTTDNKRRLTLPTDKLAYTTLKGIGSTKEIATILEFFPNTKYLKLYGCNLALDTNSNITLNLNFLQLKQLTINIRELAYQGSGFRSIALHIEEKETNQVSCFKWKRDRLYFNEIAFEPVDSLYLKKYGRFKSPRFNTIFIKCSRLDQIMLPLDLEENRRNSITATVNLEHNVLCTLILALISRLCTSLCI